MRHFKRIVIVIGLILLAATILSNPESPYGQTVAPILEGAKSWLGPYLLPLGTAIGSGAAGVANRLALSAQDGAGQAANIATEKLTTASSNVTDQLSSLYTTLSPMQQAAVVGGGLLLSAFLLSLFASKFSAARLIIGVSSVILFLIFIFFHFKSK